MCSPLLWQQVSVEFSYCHLSDGDLSEHVTVDLPLPLSFFTSCSLLSHIRIARDVLCFIVAVKFPIHTETALALHGTEEEKERL